MAEDSHDQDQKTEEPTSKRLEDARERGEVVTSREVNNLFVLGAGALALGLGVPNVIDTLTPTLSRFLESPHDLLADPDGIGVMVRDLMTSIGGALALPFGLLVAGAVLGGLVQHGFLFTTQALSPKLERISPLNGLERLFSGKSLLEFAKGLLKLGIVGAVAAVAIAPYFERIVQAASFSLGQIDALMNDLARRLFFTVVAVMAVVAAADYLLQRFQFMRRMRMSRQEIRDEFKQTEGDPAIKSRLRQLRMERARRRMMAAVPQADVVVTNPTHYAVALKYDIATMPAPQLVAKGADRIAQKIREVAEAHGVPIVENPPLARALHAGVELDAYVPEQHYRAVAEVIGYVMRLKGKLPRRAGTRA